MNVKIALPSHRKASTGRTESLTAMLSRALHNEPDLAYMVPDSATRSLLSPSFFSAALRAGQLHGEIHTTENGDGAAIWIHPDEGSVFRHTMRAARMALPFGETWEFNKRFLTLDAAVEGIRKRLAPAPHWYLMILGAEPCLKGEDIAESLIKPIVVQADFTQTPCYLETFNEKWLTVFEHLGFAITGAGRIPGGGPNFWAMMRVQAVRAVA